MPSNDAVLETLIDARTRISDPENWTKGFYWVAPAGHDATDITRETAYAQGLGSFCSLGALSYSASKLCRKYGTPLFTIAAEPFREAIAELFPERAVNSGQGYTVSIVSFNDHDNTTHEDVIKAFDRAIEKVQIDG